VRVTWVPPAELGAHLAHLDDADLVGVLLVEDGMGPRLHGMLLVEDARLDGEVGLDEFVGDRLDPVQFVVLYAGEVREVEAQALGVDERAACLT